MVNDTCDKKCPYWKQYKTKCPNYLETTWQEDGNNQTKLISDCAPKRSVIMMMEFHNCLLGAQKASEQARNSSDKVGEQLLELTSILRMEESLGREDAVSKLSYIELPRGSSSSGRSLAFAE